MDSNPPTNYPPDAAYWDPQHHPPPHPVVPNLPSKAPTPIYVNHPYHHHYNQSQPNFNYAPNAPPAFTPQPAFYLPDRRKRKFPHLNRGPHASFENSAKLYVSQLPKTCTDEDIRSVFGQYGKILEVAFIRDKRSGQQQGTCFVKFTSVGGAEGAIRALHNQYSYPGETESLKVKFADGEHERLSIHGVKLFVKNLSRQATKKEMEELFSKYGDVEDVHIFHDELKQSRGTGFIKFSHRYMAEAAINALSGTYFMKDCEHPLVVRFADAKSPPSRDPRYNLPPTRDITAGQVLPCNIHQALAINVAAPVQTRPKYPSSQTIALRTHKQPQTTAPSVSNSGFHPQQRSNPLIPPAACCATNTSQESSPQPDMVSLVESPSKTLETHAEEHGLSQQLNKDHIILHQEKEDQLMSRLLDPNSVVEQLSKDQSSLLQQTTEQGLLEQTWCTKSKPPTANYSADVETLEPKAQCGSPLMSSNLDVISCLDCDWSEHFCPDGHKYYYNSETCESRWEKPLEYASFEKHVLKLIQKETSYSESQALL